MQRFEVISGWVGDIPILTIAPYEAERCPVVISISGYGNTKESGLRSGYDYARKGFFFIAFDALMHGERYDERVDRAAEPAFGGIYPPESGLDMGVVFYQIIQQCALDVQALMHHLAGDPRADVSRVGVTGLSMGGYASFLAFATIPGIRAAAPMISLPSFTRRWKDVLDECAFSNPEWAGALDRLKAETQAYTDFIASIDPYEKLKKAAPRPLFMLNCDFDTSQPKQYSLDAYRELLPCYAQAPENLKIRIYSAPHTVIPEMTSDAVDWFAAHLIGEPGRE